MWTEIYVKSPREPQLKLERHFWERPCTQKSFQLSMALGLHRSNFENAVMTVDIAPYLIATNLVCFLWRRWIGKRKNIRSYIASFTITVRCTFQIPSTPCTRVIRRKPAAFRPPSLAPGIRYIYIYISRLPVNYPRSGRHSEESRHTCERTQF